MTELIHAIDGATATTTSAAINVECAEKIMLWFKRSDHNSGSTAFTVTVSFDGTTFIAYSKLISNTTNTNSQDVTRVATVTLSSDTSSFVTIDPDDGFKEIKITATETTDGTHDAYAFIEY